MARGWVVKARRCEVRRYEVTVGWVAVATRPASRFKFPGPNATTKTKGEFAGELGDKIEGRVEGKVENNKFVIVEQKVSWCTTKVRRW